VTKLGFWQQQPWQCRGCVHVELSITQDNYAGCTRFKNGERPAKCSKWDKREDSQ